MDVASAYLRTCQVRVSIGDSGLCCCEVSRSYKIKSSSLNRLLLLLSLLLLLLLLLLFQMLFVVVAAVVLNTVIVLCHSRLKSIAIIICFVRWSSCRSRRRCCSGQTCFHFTSNLR